MTVYWPNGSLDRPRVSSDFDAARKNPVTGIVQPHNGIDLVGWVDNCSPVDGTVVFAGYNGGAGNEVRIRADGPTAFHVGDHYRILHHASLYVSTGQRVKARQPVGRMGTTGQSTGVHCHFETHEWRLWNPVNPTDYMRRANAGGSPAGGEEDDMFSDADRRLLQDVQSRLRGDTARPYDMLQSIESITEESRLRLRGDTARPYDMLQSIESITEESRVRLRGPVDRPYDMLQSIDGAVLETRARVRGPVDRPYDMLQSIEGIVGNTTPAAIEFDEDDTRALAASIVALLPAAIGTLSSDTIDELVKRLLDEQSKRLAQ